MNWFQNNFHTQKRFIDLKNPIKLDLQWMNDIFIFLVLEQSFLRGEFVPDIFSLLKTGWVILEILCKIRTKSKQ